MRKFFVAACLSVATAAPALADNWPTFRGGPERTDISRESGLLKQWPAGGPKQVWENKDVGLGYSGYAIVGDTLYTMGARNNQEHLIAVSVADGKQKWAVPMGPALANKWGGGPRGTPTVDGDLVFGLSGQGNLLCASISTGKTVWQTTMKDLGGKTPGWGYTESVLVDGDNVICTPGGKQGTIAALNKKTGKVVWQSKDVTEDAQYASVIAFDLGGKHQLAQLTMRKLFGLDAKTGQKIWEADWPGKTAVIPTLIYHDGHIFVTSGYTVGCALFKIDGDKAQKVYDNKDMTNHHGGVVLVGDYLYGHSDKGGWTCMEFKSGKTMWQENKLEKGSITCADGMLYLLGQKSGEAVLIDASEKGWQEHGRFKLPEQTQQRSKDGGIWTHPVVADGKLYLRDQELLFCFDVKAK